MTNNNASDASALGSDSLYGWWFDAIPNLLAQLAPAAGSDMAAPVSNRGAPPLPTGQMSQMMGQMGQALGLAQRLMKPLYEVLFQALTLNQSGHAFDRLEQSLQGWMGNMTDRLSTLNQALSVQPALASAIGAGWANAPFASLAEAMTPLSLNLERAYGGLADAFGLASSRALQQALRDMAAASVAHRQAQVEYLGLVVGALAKGNDGLMTQLADMGRRGESIDSVKALVRLWARTADQSMHTAMRSPGALEASARLVRTAMQSRGQQQRVVAIASQALNIPTRAEVDEAYREIQELKRELRRLRKPQASEVEASPAVARTRAARAAPAMAPAKTPAPRKTTAKAPAARKAGPKVRKAAST
jgi:class III poly(R)-hydroxyalkanoic acid synthase PhaE subunit